ncbi:MAG TPA: hypothetical protein VKA65_02840, partial [Acidimicrobiales bacterium]|nr:hypothetical protein [Acidimicrobiales bacterium]
MATTEAEVGRITDEAVDRLRARVGVPEPHPQPPHYTELTTDVFRHVAEAYGDDNPLWCDSGYGAGTRWEGPIAPPPLVGGDTLIGEDEVTRVAPEHAELMRGDPLRGVHAFYSASAREWWEPLRPGARVTRRNALVGVLDKPSSFAERAVHEWTGQVFRQADGPLLSAQYRLMIRTERSKARKAKKYDDVELAPYTDDQIAEIEAQYAAEGPRGAEPRWWEDVAEGDTVGPMVKGPLTVTDIVCWHVGMGMGLYGVAPLRLGAANRRRIPRFFHRDPQNVPDVMQRAHWDPEFARRSGNPTTFDYGRMRETWLVHLSPTGWATTPGCGGWTASSGASTTWATPSGCGALSPVRTSPRATARPSTSTSWPRTNAARSPRRGMPPCCCPAATTGRCASPTRPAAPPTCPPPSTPSPPASPAGRPGRTGERYPRPAGAGRRPRRRLR